MEPVLQFDCNPAQYSHFVVFALFVLATIARFAIFPSVPIDFAAGATPSAARTDALEAGVERVGFVVPCHLEREFCGV